MFVSSMKISYLFTEYISGLSVSRVEK